MLLIASGEEITTGSPTIEGAKVIATCLGDQKGDKIIVFKYKPKVRYRRKTGHRQLCTKLAIKEIIKPEGKPQVRRKTRSKKYGDNSEGN